MDHRWTVDGAALCSTISTRRLARWRPAAT